MSDVEFRDPPPKRGHGASGASAGKHAGIAKSLRDRPQEWAFIGSYSRSMSSQFTGGTLKAYWPRESYEFTARANGNKNTHYDVYGRYVGDTR